MLHNNNTPLAAIGFEQWHPNGATMAVISARGRIRIEEDGLQYFEDGVDLVLADEFAGDPHKTAMLRCNDLIPFKPSADITLNANLYGQESSRFLQGTVRIGDRHVAIRGCGPRHWYHDDRWRLSTPDPISELHLCYTRATGGRVVGHPDGDADPRNPIGTGVIHPDYTPKTVEVRAPQIVSGTDAASLNPEIPPDPAGFGPVSPWWQARQQYVGTYDDNWIANVHPRLPIDFDYRHYQVAHPDLVLPHYLLPGMVLQTEGLRPNGQNIDIHIPDVVPYARFGFTDGREVPVRLHLDGMHLDLTTPVPTYDLTWRAWIEICPAFYRVDLDMARSARVAAMSLPVSGTDGLMEDKFALA